SRRRIDDDFGAATDEYERTHDLTHEDLLYLVAPEPVWTGTSSANEQFPLLVFGTLKDTRIRTSDSANPTAHVIGLPLSPARCIASEDSGGHASEATRQVSMRNCTAGSAGSAMRSVFSSVSSQFSLL